MEGEESPPEEEAPSLHAKFYRFLGGAGAVLSPPNPKDIGELNPRTEAQLGLKKLPEAQQIGYIRANSDAADEIVDQVVAGSLFFTPPAHLTVRLALRVRPQPLTQKKHHAEITTHRWLACSHEH